MKFGEQFKCMRLESKISLKYVAEQAGVSATFINDIERGNRPPTRLSMVRQMLNCLAITVDAKRDMIELAHSEYIGHFEEKWNK